MAAKEPKKHEMPTQKPEVRAHNFDEVALGYTAQIASEEAQRCLGCKNKPCTQGCPVNIDIPEFIAHIKQDDVEGAYDVITKSSSLPAVCGRVCPQESQCEKQCTLSVKLGLEPVGIGRLERFVADTHRENKTGKAEIPASNGHKVAVIGSGPSGLTCAGDLAKNGCSVTVFEALHTAGGVLVYGIPEFRLPKSIVADEVNTLKELGVEIMTDVIIGKTLTIDELFEQGFEAVFIGSGAGLPNFMGIPGESLCGVYSANEFLTRSNLMKAYRSDSRTPIMKGGNVAAETWLWTRRVRQCVSARIRCISSTAVRLKRCPRERKKSSTQWRRASNSKSSATPQGSSDIRTRMTQETRRTGLYAG